MGPDFLITLAQELEDEQMSRLEDLGIRYLNHTLPPWFDKLWLSQETVALFKTKEKLPTQLRPIGMRNPLVKTHKKTFIFYLGLKYK